MRTVVVATLLVLILLAVMIWSGYQIHFKLGIEDLGAWGSYLTGTGTVLLGIMAVYAAIQGLNEYSKRNSAERVRWLEEFYERFFENKRFRRIRQLIDFEDINSILILIRRDASAGATFEQEERDIFDEFTDYLNFFEMVAHLKESGQLTAEDVKATFDYYLRRLTRQSNPEIREYLKKNGFESLDKLLLEYEK